MIPRVREMEPSGAWSPEAGQAARAMLEELYSRVQLANEELSNLISGQTKYFYEVAEAIIYVFDLPTSKADALREFAEKLASLLDIAYPQVTEKLEKTLTAIENDHVYIAQSPRNKTLHIITDEKWHIGASANENWLFYVPIHRVSNDAKFPEILNLSSQDLYYLQAGWRASDEEEDKGKPGIGTTKTWQVLAWATVRYGSLHILLKRLNLNASNLSITWQIRTKSWKEQWSGKGGKRCAQQVAKQHPLGMLTWYLGDGCRHKEDLKYKVGNNDEYKPKSLVAEMLQAAYHTGYGKLLDLLDSEKWIALKNLEPKRKPVHATFQGYTFWLKHREGKLEAQVLLKDSEEATRLADALRALGIEARHTLHVCAPYKYHLLRLNGHSIVNLAERYPEWRRALKQLAQKYNIQPKGPVTRRLLELAENQPNQNKS
jgi:hypothetical protein